MGEVAGWLNLGQMMGYILFEGDSKVEAERTGQVQANPGKSLTRKKIATTNNRDFRKLVKNCPAIRSYSCHLA